MAMIGIKIYCTECDKWHKVDATTFSEIPNKCPKCKSKDVWFGSVIRDGKPEKEIELGMRSSGNCFTAKW